MYLEELWQVVQLQELYAQSQSTGSPEHAIQVLILIYTKLPNQVGKLS